MSSWTDTVNEWFTKGLIASGKIIAENKILITPGIENFSFHFTRDLIPMNSHIKCETSDDGVCTLSFDDWNNMQEVDKEVFEALRKNSTP